MQTITISAERTISGNHVGAPMQSGRPIDVPTGERVLVELDGATYERTIYERRAWRNHGEDKTRVRFVIVNGTNYLL